MCGIAGYIASSSIPRDRVADTLELMRNRGPDNREYKEFCQGDVVIGLLHSRLSILDLDPRSNQPFTIGDCTLIFNGEIYNYIELKEDLEKRGVVFKTRSDTEVLLQSYLSYGEDCVTRFEGMWSFAIYDKSKGRLFLSRDRFAEKPLYFYETPTEIFFGSEIKFIRGLSGESLSVNKRQLLRYMVNGYKSLYKTDDTFFEGIKEVPFATNMIIDVGLKPRLYRYWVPKSNETEMSLADAVEGFREKLLNSIAIRLRSDVPLAFCLSGGVDSSTIVSIAAKCFNYDVATFSIVDLDERYDERDNILATVNDLQCKNTMIETSRTGFFDRLDDLVSYHDSPLATISYYVHSFLSEAISKQGYKLVCSGTGADEMVTGYYDHFNLYLYETRNSPNYSRYLDEWKKNAGRFVRNPYLKNPKLFLENSGFRDHVYFNSDMFSEYMKEKFAEPFVEEKYCDGLLHNRMMNEMFHEGTRVILHEDDLNSMQYSIENRSPYLDTNLFEFSYSIPTEHLISEGYGKYILREAVKGVLNDKVRLDRIKKGFNASINSLVDFEDGATRDRILADGPVYELVDREKIRSIMKADSLPNSVSKFWFNFLNVQMFLDQNK